MTDAPVVRKDAEGRIVFEPDGETLKRFMRSNARVRVIRGPIRSGTSSVCCMEIWRRACEQKPGPDGVRDTRWFVSRNTYAELQESTIPTWLAWFPEKDFGRFIWGKPFRHEMRKGPVRAEVVFLALDDEGDIKKLKSTEWTGGFLNEMQYGVKEVFDEAESRIGYYPALKDGGPTWSGLIADMNAPTEDHWLVRMTGEVPLPEDMPEHERSQYRWPEGWEYFVQPPALIEVLGADGKSVVGYDLNPKAENLKWIPKDTSGPVPQHRYLSLLKGKSKRWIDSNLMNRITAPLRGTPVWPEFREEVHVAKEEMRFNPAHGLYVGLDFGRRPAAVFGQIINDRWVILAELTGYDVSATIFAPRVRRFLETRFGWDEAGAASHAKVMMFGDPKGQDKTQSDEQTAYDVFRANGLIVRPAPVKGNNINTRIEAVSRVLGEMRDGMPRFLLDPKGCPTLKMAMAGGYHFKEKSEPPEPEKAGAGARYSDVADALQYLMIGGGEARALVGLSPVEKAAPVQTWRGRRSLRRA